MIGLAQRQRAVQACIDRFVGKPFRWGVADCVRLARHDLHAMGVKTAMLKGVAYRSELGAARALKAAGHADLIAAVDAMGFVRVPPARAWMGDLMALPCEDGREPWGAALVVAKGDGAVIGFQGGFGVEMRPTAFTCAWRVA